MIRKTSKDQTRQKIHSRIRKTLAGTTERPRLNIYRSVNHIYAQVIDDAKGETIVAAASIEKGKAARARSSDRRQCGGGQASGQDDCRAGARQNGIKKVVFDRGGYLYHGRVKALADAAREAGLEF